MKLYYSPGACSLAPHVALREIGVDFELVEIRVADRQNFTPEYLVVNPRARVPALDVDGRIYTEAPALLVYIASLRPELELLPLPGTEALARCLEWMMWFSSSLHIGYAQHWRPERFLPAGAEATAFTERGKEIISQMNIEVEQRLVGPWFLGDEFSLADIYALPFYRWGNRISLPMTECCPRWTEWSEQMLRRPSVRSAIAREGIGEDLFRAQAPVQQRSVIPNV